MYVFGSGRHRRRGGEWMRGFGLAFTNSAGTRGVLNVCLCLGCGGVGGLGRKCVGACNWIWKSGVVLCLCDL